MFEGRPSSIHGNGGFAIIDIKEGILITLPDAHTQDEINFRGFNWSDNPNIVLKTYPNQTNVDCFALRNISKDEELTVKYYPEGCCQECQPHQEGREQTRKAVYQRLCIALRNPVEGSILQKMHNAEEYYWLGDYDACSEILNSLGH